MSVKNALLCLCFAIALPLGQMLFKFAADHSRVIPGGFFAKLVFNPPLIGALAWYGLTALLWFYILTRVQLSAAYPFSILGSALVPILAWVLFRETISPQVWLGFAIMLTGFALVVRG